MRQVLKIALAGLAIGALAPAVLAQNDYDDVVIRTESLGHGLYVLFGAGGNIGVSAGEDGVFLIDDQYAPLTDRVVAAIAEISDKPIRFVINSHWHGDHTGGNENLGKLGATIIAHDHVRARLSSPQVVRFPGGDSTSTPTPKIGLPVITFSQDLSLHLNGEEARVSYIAGGHSDGDSIIVFKGANVIHTGDLFFSLGYPFLDLNSGGSVAGTLAGLEMILANADDDTQIIPGHGPMADKAKVRSVYDAVKAISERVAKLIAEGKSLEEIQAAKPSADFDEEWGQWFVPPDFLVMTFYESLQAEK